MKPTKQILFGLISFAALLVLSNCKSRQLNQDATAAEDNNIAEAKWDDVGDQVDGSVELNPNDTIPAWNNCATLRVDTLGSPFPILFTLDFGETECLCDDGRLRKGSIIYELSGFYRMTGTTVKVSTDDYFVDGYKVVGSRITTNLGKNSNDLPEFSIQVSDAEITTPEGETITWNCDRTRTWAEGSETGFFTKDTVNGGVLGWAGLLDDVYEITGLASGTTRDGRAYTATITSPIRVELDCKWITSGEVELKPDELLTRTLNYGDGTCDDAATVTIGRKSYDITLHQ